MSDQTAKEIYFRERRQQLTDIEVAYGPEKTDFVSFTHTDWAMTINFDLETNELIFKTVLGPDKWLAIGLANNLTDADVIQWVSALSVNQLMLDSKAMDQLSVKGVLLDTPNDHLTTTKVLDIVNSTVEMTTKRAFDTKDPLDKVVDMDSMFQLTFAMGEKLSTTWETRTNLGNIDLFISDVPLQELVIEKTIPFDEARIHAYEIHGWLCLVAWFPIGFALIATKRYYKTKWFLMHHMHNLLGFLVTAVTIVTCM